MMRSRTKIIRRKRARRRLKLFVANGVLLALIIVIGVWNGLGSETPERVEPTHAPEAPPAGENAPKTEPQDSSPPDRAEERTDSAGQGTENGQGADSVKLAFVGDILLGEYVGTLLKQHGYDYPYEHVQSVLREADVAAANLESAVTGPQEKPGKKTYEFRSDPEALPALKAAGISLVSLANNHTLDFGANALRDTMRHLKENDISYVGAGEDADEAYAPVYIERNGIRIAFLAFSRVIPFVEWKAGKNQLGVAETYDYTRPVKAIQEAEENADLVVVYAHWGEERMLEHEEAEQGELGRRFVDAGADLVIGSHPHVLQGYEYYKDRWIAYSLGNFIFTKSKDPITYDSGVLVAECDRSGACSLQLTPFRVDTPKPVPMETERSAELLRRLSSLSVGAVINERGDIVPDPAN